MSNPTVTLTDVIKFIRTCSKDERRALTEVIRDQIDSENADARSELQVGDKVEFTGKYGILEKGVITKKNPKMIKVKTERGAMWRVAPTLLRKAT